MHVMELIRNIDILGEVFNFTIFGKSTYNTFFGGSLTLMIIIFTVIICFFFGLDLILRTSPTVIMERDVPDKYSYINCNLTNFPIYWRISNDDDETIDFSNLFYPQLNLYIHKFNTVTGAYDLIDVKNMKSKYCTKELVQNDYLYDQLGLNQYFCLDFSDSGYPLGGFWGNNDMVYYFEKVFYTCPNDNKTSPNCTDQSYIKKFLGSSKKIFYEIFYPIAYLSPSNYTNPMKITMNKYFQMLSPNLYKKNRYFFSETQLYSDKGWIFSDSDRMSFIAYDNSNSDIDYKSDDDLRNPNISSSLYAVTIYLSKDHNKYNLSYMKLQDLAAQVGGIIQILMIICQILNYNVNAFNRDLDIINSLFELEKQDLNDYKVLDLDKSSSISQYLRQKAILIDGKDDNSIIPKKINNFVMQSDNTINIDKDLPPVTSIKSAVFKYEEKTKSERHKGLSVTVKGFFKYFCRFCFLTKKEEENNRILDIGKKYLTMKLDLNNYLKMSDHINRLKSLLLKPYQIFLLDNQKKINLYSPKDKIQLDIVDEQFSSENEVHLNILQLLIQKIKENSLNSIDTLLYKNLDTKLKKMIEELIISKFI